MGFTLRNLVSSLKVFVFAQNLDVASFSVMTKHQMGFSSLCVVGGISDPFGFYLNKKERRTDMFILIDRGRF